MFHSSSILSLLKQTVVTWVNHLVVNPYIQFMVLPMFYLCRAENSLVGVVFGVRSELDFSLRMLFIIIIYRSYYQNTQMRRKATFLWFKRFSSFIQPFFDACLEFDNRIEAEKYVPRVLPENKVACFVKLGYENLSYISFPFSRNLMNFIASSRKNTQKFTFKRIMKSKERPNHAKLSKSVQETRRWMPSF